MAGTSAPQIPDCRDLALVGERLARTLYTGHSDGLGRAVTVTVYPPLADARARQRFDDAATRAQRLGAHPSVLTIHDWGHAPDGRPWLVNDWQPAETVDSLLKTSGPLDVERALQIGVLVAGALATAHRAGIVHGDLSPDRLVFGSRGEPLVAEIGLAEFGSFPGLGALNNPIRYYAPPEVLERTGVTAASDVYSLATTVYALLAGRAPHEKPADITDSNASLLLRILQIEVPPIDRPDLPAGVDDVLRSGLAHTSGKRATQIIELAWGLQDVQRRAGLPVTEPVVLDLDDLPPVGPVSTAVAPAPTPAPVVPTLPTPPSTGSADPPEPGQAPRSIAGPATYASSRPPELDALPAWYTDPLPNGPGPGVPPAADLVYLFSDTPPDRTDRSPRPHGGPDAPLPGGDPGWVNGHDPAGDMVRGNRFHDPLPHVIGSEGTNGSNGHGPPRHGGNVPAMPAGLDHDLDPSVQRLPGRYEVEQDTRPRVSSAAPTLPADRRPAPPSEPLPLRAVVAPSGPATRPGSALDRVREARVDGRRSERSSDDGDTDAPVSGRPDASPRPSGPAALPVIVLIVIVVALTIGVAYMIVTGDDPADPVASDELQSGAAAPSDDAADAPAAPTGLVVTETEAGVQLAWHGTVGTSYVVRVLSTDAAPRPLPATAATTMVVASSDIQPATAYCFDVAVAVAGAGTAGAEAQAPSSPACIRGASADSMRTQ